MAGPYYVLFSLYYRPQNMKWRKDKFKDHQWCLTMLGFQAAGPGKGATVGLFLMEILLHAMGGMALLSSCPGPFSHCV